MNQSGGVEGLITTDDRIFVNPMLNTMSGCVGQLVMNFKDGNYIGTGAIGYINYLDYYVLTCAHNFVHIDPLDSSIRDYAIGG